MGCNVGLDQLPNITTIKELSDFLKVSVQSIKRAIYSGKLKAFKVGRDWRIEKDAVIEWIEQGK